MRLGFIGLVCLIVSLALLLLVPALREATWHLPSNATREPDASPIKRLRSLVRRLLPGGKN